jgi:acyl-coenzyme A synthetase/AMP-(fatty) acid ligase
MIAETIFEWAERAPTKPAVVYNGQALSYRAFAANIALARGYFASRDCLGPGLVIVVIDSMLDFWVVSLALRSLGRTTIAVQSVAAFDDVLDLPHVRCVVASAGEAMTGLDERCATLSYPLLRVSLAGESALGPADIPAPERPGGHILQTSGTTGMSKRVLIDPSFEPAFMGERRRLFEIDQDAVVNAFGFGGGTAIGYFTGASTWMGGATAVIDEGREPHLSLLYPGITHASVTPDLLGQILAAPAGSFPRSEIMHLMVTSGAITRAQVDEAKARITPHLFNRIAATEISNFAYTRLDSPEDHRWHRLVPGRNVQIVDDFDRPVPIGEVGRLRVSAADGPSGYLYDEATTKAFFKDGFFYPGDLGVMREDGRMALQGRVTDVLNVKGHKILPAPIEDRLREAFGVSGVCLLTMQDDNGEEELHVMIETPHPIAAETLSAELSRELRGFAGARVHFVPALPRNAMGKVVRRNVVALARAAR